MARYYAYDEKNRRPSQVRRVDPSGQAVVSRGGVAPAGYYMAGTQTLSNKAGSRTYSIFRPLPKAAPAPAPAPPPPPPPAPPAPAQPSITPEMEEYRRQADAALKAAEERLAQFAIDKSAFETRQQEAAAAAAQREAQFQAAMKQREEIFAQTSAAKTADMAKRAAAFEQQMEQQRAELAAQSSERQALFAKSMEEQRAALSGQTAELGRQRTAFETEMLGARQEFAGQREAFEKSAAEREEAFQKMTIQQQEAFRKEQKEAEAAANRAAAVRSANQRQSELAQTIQVQPAEGATRRFAGTQGFRRRAAQFGTTSPYKGLGTIQSGMVNV